MLFRRLLSRHQSQVMVLTPMSQITGWKTPRMRWRRRLNGQEHMPTKRCWRALLLQLCIPIMYCYLLIFQFCPHCMDSSLRNIKWNCQRVFRGASAFRKSLLWTCITGVHFYFFHFLLLVLTMEPDYVNFRYWDYPSSRSTDTSEMCTAPPGVLVIRFRVIYMLYDRRRKSRLSCGLSWRTCRQTVATEQRYFIYHCFIFFQ